MQIGLVIFQSGEDANNTRITITITMTMVMHVPGKHPIIKR